MRNRRIKRSRLQTIYLRNRSVTKDNEGVPTESFGEAYEKKAEVWAASERRQIEMYGDRVSNIANVRVQGRYDIEMRNSIMHIVFEDGNSLTTGDGVCINVAQTDSPDYRVLTITPHRPVRLEIERI